MSSQLSAVTSQQNRFPVTQRTRFCVARRVRFWVAQRFTAAIRRSSPTALAAEVDIIEASQTHGFIRWLKFNLVGAIGIAIQLGALALFRSVLHFNYLLATALAVETAVIHNFLWHESFTWGDRASTRMTQSLARLAKFNASNGLVSLIGNLLIMRALVGGLGLNYFLANLIAVAACSIVNFLLSDRFVFESKAD